VLVKLVRTLWDPLFASAILCGRMRMAANQGRREVTMEFTCPHCRKTFNTRYDEVRIRSGSFRIPGEDEPVDQLCETCHREVVKEG